MWWKYLNRSAAAGIIIDSCLLKVLDLVLAVFVLAVLILCTVKDSAMRLTSRGRERETRSPRHIAITHFCHLIQLLCGVHCLSSGAPSQAWDSVRAEEPTRSHYCRYGQYYTSCTDISLFKGAAESRGLALDSTLPLWSVYSKPCKVTEIFCSWAPKVLTAVQTYSHNWLNPRALCSHAKPGTALCDKVSNSIGLAAPSLWPRSSDSGCERLAKVFLFFSPF